MTLNRKLSKIHDKNNQDVIIRQSPLFSGTPRGTNCTASLTSVIFIILHVQPSKKGMVMHGHKGRKLNHELP